PTRMGQVVGTPAFMAPEQAEGKLDRLGPATDVYSLGATLYCLLTGQAPFAARPVETTLRQGQRGEVAPVRQLKPEGPAALAAVCHKAMARRPQDRYASALALASDLEHWLADEPVTAYREPLREQARRWLRRHRTLASSATVLLLTAVVG